MATVVDEEVGWVQPPPANTANAAANALQQLPRTTPLYQHGVIKLATPEDIAAGLDQSQLRTRCHHTPSDATFKDVARHCTFLALNGMRSGAADARARSVMNIPLPSQMLQAMTTRAMSEHPAVSAKARALYRTVAARGADAVGAANGGAPADPGADPQSPQGCDAATLRRFFTTAIVAASYQTIPVDLAAVVAGVEVRRMKRGDTGSTRVSSGKSLTLGGSKYVASADAFRSSLIGFGILMCANGPGFAAPVEEHLVAFFDFLEAVTDPAAGADSLLGSRSPRRVPKPPPKKPAASLAVSSAEGRGLGTTLVRVPRGGEAPAELVPRGFLPPANPRAVATTFAGATVPRLNTPRGAGIAPLPVIQPVRMVDAFDPNSVALSDAAIGMSVAVSATATQDRQKEQRAEMLRSHRHAIADGTASRDSAAALRLRLGVLEKYPRGPPGVARRVGRTYTTGPSPNTAQLESPGRHHSHDSKLQKKSKADLLTLVPPDDQASLFERIDPNGNGMLSLAELDKGVLELWPDFNNKPAIMRAYKAADANGTGWISRKEFPKFLDYLVHYHNLFVTFSDVDTSGDRRITKDEFIAGATKMRGLAGAPPAQLALVFDRVDANGGGVVLFQEFCEGLADLLTG